MLTEKDNATFDASAGMEANRTMDKEHAEAHGRFHVECVDIGGKVLWTEDFDNVVTDVGARLALTTFLSGSAYTVVGPFIGLISLVSYTSGPVAGDTMASHAGWTEAGGTNAPTYTAPRKTAAWAAASGRSMALSAPLAFVAGSTGTIKGCFLVFGAGAVATIDSAAGTLYSAGLFTGGDQPVVATNTVNVSYTASL